MTPEIEEISNPKSIPPNVANLMKLEEYGSLCNTYVAMKYTLEARYFRCMRTILLLWSDGDKNLCQIPELRYMRVG